MMLEKCFFLLNNFEGFKIDNSFLFTVSNFENNTFSTNSSVLTNWHMQMVKPLCETGYFHLLVIKIYYSVGFNFCKLLKATVRWNRGNHLICIFIIFVVVFYTAVKINFSWILCSIPYFVIIYFALKETMRPVFFCIGHCQTFQWWYCSFQYFSIYICMKYICIFSN